MVNFQGIKLAPINFNIKSKSKTPKSKTPKMKKPKTKKPKMKKSRPRRSKCVGLINKSCNKKKTCKLTARRNKGKNGKGKKAHCRSSKNRTRRMVRRK